MSVNMSPGEQQIVNHGGLVECSGIMEKGSMAAFSMSQHDLMH